MYLYPPHSVLAFPGLDLRIVRELDLFWLKRAKSDSWSVRCSRGDIGDASLCLIYHFLHDDLSTRNLGELTLSFWCSGCMRSLVTVHIIRHGFMWIEKESAFTVFNTQYGPDIKL